MVFLLVHEKHLSNHIDKVENFTTEEPEAVEGVSPSVVPEVLDNGADSLCPCILVHGHARFTHALEKEN